MDNTKRFDGRADSYAKGRPGYPEQLIERLVAWAELGAGSTVADIGAGTGIFSLQLAQTGARVLAVEPNADMRAQSKPAPADAAPTITWVDATAEHTRLDQASVDLVTAAQAFHWFDGPAFRDECLRILRAPARVALIWNSRVVEAPVNRACEQVFRALCPRFKGFSGGVTRLDPRVVSFFNDDYDLWIFENPLRYDRQRFVERCLSGSYAPRADEENYAQFKTEVESIFDRFQEDGIITVPNETEAYVGALSKGAAS